MTPSSTKEIERSMVVVMDTMMMTNAVVMTNTMVMTNCNAMVMTNTMVMMVGYTVVVRSVKMMMMMMMPVTTDSAPASQHFSRELFYNIINRDGTEISYLNRD